MEWSTWLHPRKKKSERKTANNNNGSIPELLKELWQAAVNLRGSIEPADYKRYVLPIIFLHFLSMRYEKRREELEKMVVEPQSDYQLFNKGVELITQEMGSLGCWCRSGNEINNI